jgi:hypothetical protein
VSAPRDPRRLLPWAILVFAGAVIGPLRGALNARYLRESIEHDVYPLPPPPQTVVLSLGYRAALADLIFAQVLVSYGIHFQEKRLFEFAGNYLDAINELDPKFERPYRLADTLLTLQVKQVGAANFRKARSIQERGMKEFPFDAALWSSAGQFMAYLGPGGLTNPAEQDEWRLAGGRALAHACELVTNDDTIPYHCIVAAGLLTNAGAQEASRQFLERVLMVNDDPEIRALASGALAKAIGAEARDRAQARYQRFQSAWATDLPFVTRGAYLTVGPNWQPAACAGRSANCITSWRAWAAADEPDLSSSIAD